MSVTRTTSTLWAFHRALIERVQALPGVEAAGLGEEVPVSGGYGCTVQGFEEAEIYERMRDAGLTICAGQLRVTPGYFEVLGIPIEEGRGFEVGDFEDPGRGAVVVSRAFAERFWPGESPIGKGVGPSGRTAPPFFRVVGVAGDVPARSAAGGAPLSETALAVYYPVVDNPEVVGNGYWWPGSMTLVVRASSDDPLALLPAIRTAVSEIDPEVPLADARTMEMEAATVSFLTLLLGVAAAVGLFGVVSYLVGLPMAWAGARVLRSLLYGVSPVDPPVYVAAAVALLVVSLAAGRISARRASAVDPVLALRAD